MKTSELPLVPTTKVPRARQAVRCGILFLIAAWSGLFASCLAHVPEAVVVHCALDKEFSQPILKEFESETGSSVLAMSDLESNKTVGLANAILQQRTPQCDLFWNNEIMHTLRLQQAELLDDYARPATLQYPKAFGLAQLNWHGFAAGARALLINRDLMPDETHCRWPQQVSDLVDPHWKGRCAVAKRFFGTTATHAAALYSLWGNDRADEFFHELAENALIVGGNKQVALRLSRAM